MSVQADVLVAGRSCPLSYRYEPASLAHLATLEVETVYCVGGLYGNPFALTAIESLLDREASCVRVVFNGDFHWFDATAAAFEQIESRTTSDERFLRLRGNVETELASDDDIGCGCAYPESVDDGVVDRSNEMLRRLREVSRAFPSARAALAALPMSAALRVGSQRVVVVHGDLESLAGWRLDPTSLDREGGANWVVNAMTEADSTVVASSHTCLPALRQWAPAEAVARSVINNGAAGMPCLSDSRFGIVSRISVVPASSVGLQSLYGVQQNGVWIEALPLRFDFSAWRSDFLNLWPPTSAGYESYFHRIENGVNFSIEAALGKL